MFLQVQILPGIDQYLSKGIQGLGDTLSLFLPDRRRFRAIEDMIVQNPEMAQQLADLETRTPGTLESLGLGEIGETISKIGPSLDLQREQRLGGREIDVEEQELGIRSQIAEDVTKALEGTQLTPEQVEAIASSVRGAPRQAQLDVEQAQVAPSQLDSERAARELERFEAGSDISGDIFSLATGFNQGQADPNTMQQIFSDPNLLGQFQEALTTIRQREQLAAAAARASEKTPNIPTPIIQDVISFRSALSNIERAKDAVEKNPDAFGPKKRKRGILGEATDLFDPEGVAARAAVEGAVSEIRRSFLGTQMPASELANARPLYPSPEMEPDAIIDRLGQLEALSNTKLGEIGNVYGEIPGIGGGSLVEEETPMTQGNVERALVEYRRNNPNATREELRAEADKLMRRK